VPDSEAVAKLLEEVSETHHRVFRITDGADDDWASWYADWLLDHSELPDLLGARPVRSHLVHALVDLDRAYARDPEGATWPVYYATRLPALLA